MGNILLFAFLDRPREFSLASKKLRLPSSAMPFKGRKSALTPTRQLTTREVPPIHWLSPWQPAHTERTQLLSDRNRLRQYWSSLVWRHRSLFGVLTDEVDTSR